MALLLLVGVAIVATEATAYGLPKSSGDEYAYVLVGYNDIYAINTNTDTVVDILHVTDKASVYNIALNPTGTYLLAIRSYDYAIDVYNTLDNSYVKTITGFSTAAGVPFNVIFDSTGTYGYVLCKNDPFFYIARLDMRTLSITATLNTTMRASVWANTQDVPIAITPNDDLICFINDTAVGSVYVSSTTMTVNGIAYTGNVTTLRDIEYYMGGVPGSYQFLVTDSSTNIVYYWRDFAGGAFSGNWLNYGKSAYMAMDYEHQWVYAGDYYSPTGNISVYTAMGGWQKNITIPRVETTQMPAVGSFKMVSGGSKIYASMGFDNRVAVIDLNNSTIRYYLAMGNKAGVIVVGSIRGTDAGMQYVTLYTKTAFDTILLENVGVTIYDDAGRFIYTGKTDASGAATFYMSALQPYKIRFNQSPNINLWCNITPSSQTYVIRIPVAQVLGIGNLADQFLNQTQQANIAYNVTSNLNVSDSVATFNCSYSDGNLLTTAITFSLYVNNSTVNGGNASLVSSTTIAGSSGLANFSNPNGAGKSYYVLFNTSQTTGTNKTYYVGMTTPGPKWWGGILPLQWYWWFAFIPIFLIMGAGVATKKGLIGICGTVAGFLFLQAGWWQITPIAGIIMPDLVMGMVLALCLMLSILMMVTEREKYS